MLLWRKKPLGFHLVAAVHLIKMLAAVLCHFAVGGQKTRRSRTFLTNKGRNLMISVCGSKFAYYIIFAMRYPSPNNLFRIV